MPHNEDMEKMQTTIPTRTKNIFYHYIPFSFRLSLYPNLIGYEICRRNKLPVFSREKKCFTMHIVLGGAGYIETNGKTLLVSEGSVFFFYPYQEVKYYPDPENPWIYFWFEFNGETAKDLLQASGIDEKTMLLRPAYIEEIKDLIYRLLEDDTKFPDEARELFVSSSLLTIFGYLISEQKESHREKGKGSKERLHAIVSYLDEHFCDEGLSLKDVASKFYLTQQYVTRLFKKEMGISPLQYVIDLRMKKAIEMLSYHNFSIAEISDALGYKSQFYFCREFKKRFNVPPSKYKSLAMK